MPLNIFDTIPEAVNNFSKDIQNVVHGQFQTLEYLEGITEKVTSANIKAPFIFGIGFVVVFATTLFFSVFLMRTVTNTMMKTGVCILAILCCIPFAIPTAILSYVGSKIQESGPVVSIEKGGAASLAIGALVCAIMLLLTSVILVLLEGDLLRFKVGFHSIS